MKQDNIREFYQAVKTHFNARLYYAPPVWMPAETVLHNCLLRDVGLINELNKYILKHEKQRKFILLQLFLHIFNNIFLHRYIYIP